MSRPNLSESFIQRVNISILQMLVRGYEPAPTSSLPAKLRAIRPNGSTAMRDAIVQGTSLMLDLFKVLNDQRMAQNWNFVHVILTDGSDNSSKVDMAKTKAVLQVIHQQLAGLNLRIIFIGVGVDSSTASILRDLAKAAGKNGAYYDINEGQIEKIFTRITVQLGLQYRRDVIGIESDEGAIFLTRDQVQRKITVTENHYAILFNLDISSSMEGRKWNSVCNSVQRFVSNLSNIDFVAGIVFDTQARLLLNEQLISQLKKQAESSARTGTQNLSPEELARARKALKCCCCCCCFIVILTVVLVLVFTL